MKKDEDQLALIPSSPSDRKELKGMLQEASNCLQRIEDEREAMKDIAAVVKEKFSIKPTLFNKLAKTFHKRDYAELQHSHEEFELLYETLMENKIVADTEDDEDDEYLGDD